jgi:hypothetical protein
MSGQKRKVEGAVTKANSGGARIGYLPETQGILLGDFDKVTGCSCAKRRR